MDGEPRRVRKAGGRCVIGFQSIAQVSETYGQGEAHTIVENCANTLILRCSASETGGTARFASTLIGEREIVRTIKSHTSSSGGSHSSSSTSRTPDHRVEQAVMVSEIETLADLQGYLKLASTAMWARQRFEPLVLPVVAPVRTPMPNQTHSTR